MAQGEPLGQAIADESRSALDADVREGTRQSLQRVLECEVEAFLAEHADRTDERDGSKLRQANPFGAPQARHHCRAPWEAVLTWPPTSSNWAG